MHKKLRTDDSVLFLSDMGEKCHELIFIIFLLAEGRKAHWGLVTGFLVLSNEEPSGADPHFRSVTLDNCESVLASFATKKLLLLGRQSKSLVLGKLP